MVCFRVRLDCGCCFRYDQRLSTHQSARFCELDTRGGGASERVLYLTDMSCLQWEVQVLEELLKLDLVIADYFANNVQVRIDSEWAGQ